MISNGKVPRRDSPDDADRFLDDLTVIRCAQQCTVGKCPLPRKLGDVLGGPPNGVSDRPLELRNICRRQRRTDLGDELGADILLLLLKGVVELHQAVLTELMIRRPIGTVEGAPRCGDRRRHVTDTPVGGHSQHLFGSGVDVDGRPT